MDSDFEGNPHPFKKEWLRSLEQKAAMIQAAGGSRITGGVDGEKPVAEWQSHDVDVKQLPPDEHGVLRISIGGGNTPVPLNYLRFRGPHGACVDLLRKALQALESGPSERN
jgi:hypothetical protein